MSINPQPAPDTVSLKKYVMIFAAAYIVLSAIAGTISVYFELDSTSAFTFATLYGSAMFAVHYFVKDHSRALLKSEIWKLTWGSCLASLLISALAVAGFVLWFMVSEGVTLEGVLSLITVSHTSLMIILAAVSVLILGLLRLGYGLSNMTYTKKLEKDLKNGSVV